MTQTILIEHKEAARSEQCRTLNNTLLLVLVNHNHLNYKTKRVQVNEGLEVDPNPSSFFLPLFFVLHNSTNLSSTITIYHLSLSKLPPTSDNLDVQVR